MSLYLDGPAVVPLKWSRTFTAMTERSVQHLDEWAVTRDGRAADGGFSELLRRYRTRAGLSQSELAARSGLAVRTIRYVELGRTSRPRPDSIRLLADALGLGDEARETFTQAAGGLLAADSRDVRPAVPSQLPRDVADFTGRTKEVGALRDHLAPGGQGRLALVRGLPGIGKTALVIHAAHDLRTSFPDGQLFADLGESGRRVAPGDVLAWFLRALGVGHERIPLDLQERAALYRTLMADRRALVVLDDVKDEAQVRPLLPGGAGCVTLMTSRLPLVLLEGTRVLALELPDVDAGVALLSRVAGRQLAARELAAAVELVELSGCLPHAVRIAGARLASQPGLSCAGLLDRLRHELATHESATWERLRVSYLALDEVERRAFRTLVWLEPPTFASWVTAPLLGLPPRAADGILQNLLAAGLLEVAGADAAGRLRYAFHELVRLFGRECAEGAPLSPGMCSQVAPMLPLRRPAPTHMMASPYVPTGDSRLERSR
jgi:transcriptional regulator with XRE-family HTH domain